MSRPVVVYLVMLVVLVGGLWAVLAIGGTLSAPEDLAGKWQLQPAVVGGSSGLGLNVEQSGKFFQVQFENQPMLDLKLVESNGSTATLANNTWQLTMMGAPGSDDKTVELTGPKPGRWAGHRITRTFPPDGPAKGAH